jgi:hypothetical protein
MVAACGLLCGPCEIRKMPFDAEAAEVTIDWYRKMGWLKETEGVKEAVERGMVCTGCKGNRSTHWSADCWILKCCVDTKGLEHCDQCTDFPCAALNEWSEKDESYSAAMKNLIEMRTKQ